MEKEFVPYELAVKLKELGFDESSMGWYSTKGVFYEDFNAIDNINLNTLTNRGSFANAILAPTWQAAFKWFRENYDMIHNIDRIFKDEFGYTIAPGDNEPINGFCFNSYEEAEITCIEKMIEIVESNLNK